MSPHKQSIQGLFTEICDQAFWNGTALWGMHTSIRREADHPERKPGLFYSRLPQEVKDRLKNELKSEHANFILTSLLRCGKDGQPLPWWEEKRANADTWIRGEKLKFEAELMKHGWKPNYSF